MESTILNNKKLCECGCGSEISTISKHRGEPRRFKRGHNRNRWKGGIRQHMGYIQRFSPDHPHVNKKGYMMEHRLVYEQYYNCCLLPWTEIHHINGNKKDNRIENIIALSNREHHAIHYKKSGLVRYQFKPMQRNP